MSVYLVTNKPARDQFRSPRRAKPSGVCTVHTAEGAGTANVAAFIRRRDTAGSYHDLVDDREALQLVRYADEAYHDGTGSNPHSYGLSFATFAARWPSMTTAQRDAFLTQGARAAARYARWLRAEHGITIPARRITRAQSDQRVPGFISHAERDPGRRTDPGPGFPWARFLELYAAEMRGPTTPTKTSDPMEQAMSFYKDRAEFEAAIRGNVRNAPITLHSGTTTTLQGAIQWLERVLIETQARTTAGRDLAAVAAQGTTLNAGQVNAVIDKAVKDALDGIRLTAGKD